MPVVRMHLGSSEALVDAYGSASDSVREQMTQLSPLVTEALALLNRGGQNPLYGPIPVLTNLTNDLRTEQQDVSWRVDFLRSTDAQPLGPTGRVRAFIPADLGSAFAQSGLTPEQTELAKDMFDDGVSFDDAAEAAKSSNPEAALDRLRLAELDEQIENWSGSDNDPILDALIAQRNDITQRQADRQREQNDLWAAFRRQEAEAWSTPELTPLEEAEHALDEIRDILDTAKQDRGDGIGSADADGVWSTNDLQAMIDNEHDYYTDQQVEYSRTVLAMAESSGDAQIHLGITQSGGGWSFADIGHLTLDIFGMVPVVGNAADGINAAWYAAEGEYLDAALSSIALIPGIGQAATLAKPAIKAAADGMIFRNLDEALQWAKRWLEDAGILRRSGAGAAATGVKGTPIPRRANPRDDLAAAIQHLDTVDGLDVPHQQAMVDAISQNIDDGVELSPAQRAFLDHELLEAQYAANGMDQWDAHELVLEDIPLGANFDPEVLVEHSEWFSKPYFDYWGIEKP